MASPPLPRCQAADTTKQNSSVLFSQGNKIENMLNIKVNLKFLRFRSNTSSEEEEHLPAKETNPVIQ